MPEFNSFALPDIQNALTFDINKSNAGRLANETTTQNLADRETLRGLAGGIASGDPNAQATAMSLGAPVNAATDFANMHADQRAGISQALAVGGQLAAAIQNAPDDQQPALWQQWRPMMLAAGLKNAPVDYPGRAALNSFRLGSLTVQQQIEARGAQPLQPGQTQTDMLDPPAPRYSTPGAAPGAGGGGGGGGTSASTTPEGAPTGGHLTPVVAGLESSGSMKPGQYGDGGKAAGPMQVHPEALADVNARLGTNYTHAQLAADPVLGKQVGDTYLGMMRQKFGRDDYALGAYNAGPGAMARAIASGQGVAGLPGGAPRYVAEGMRRLGQNAAIGGPAPVGAPAAAPRVQLASNVGAAGMPAVANDVSGAPAGPTVAASPDELQQTLAGLRVTQAAQAAPPTAPTAAATGVVISRGPDGQPITDGMPPGMVLGTAPDGKGGFTSQPVPAPAAPAQQAAPAAPPQAPQSLPPQFGLPANQNALAGLGVGVSGSPPPNALAPPPPVPPAARPAAEPGEMPEVPAQSMVRDRKTGQPIPYPGQPAGVYIGPGGQPVRLAGAPPNIEVVHNRDTSVTVMDKTRGKVIAQYPSQDFYTLSQANDNPAFANTPAYQQAYSRAAKGTVGPDGQISQPDMSAYRPPGGKLLGTGAAVAGAPGDTPTKPLGTPIVTGNRMSPKLQEMDNEDVSAIQTGAGIQTDIRALRQQLESGKLEISPWVNAGSRAANALGMSTENSRNFASFQATMSRLQNDSLRLNKGVQTEGDAQRIWQELVTGINDPGVVKQRLGEIEKINERAVMLRGQELNRRREQNGIDPIDVSKLTKQPAAVGQGQAAPVAAAEHPPEAQSAALRAIQQARQNLGPDAGKDAMVAESRRLMGIDGAR